MIKILDVDWKFIENYLPNYSSSSLVLQSDILAKYFDNELDDGEHDKDVEWVKSIGDDEDIIIYYNDLIGDLCHKALQAYKENKSIKNVNKDLITYKVNIVRISYSFASVEVSASSIEEANINALNKAGDLEYTEKDAEYKIDDF